MADEMGSESTGSMDPESNSVGEGAEDVAAEAKGTEDNAAEDVPSEEDLQKKEGLSAVTKKIGYSSVEQNILKQSGIKPKGFWFVGPDGKMIKKEEVDKTLEADPTMAIIRKLDETDKKITELGEITTSLKKTLEEQLDLQHKYLTGIEVEHAEAADDVQKEEVSPKKDKDKQPIGGLINQFAKILAVVALLYPMLKTMFDRAVNWLRSKLADGIKFLTDSITGVLTNATGFISGFIKNISEGIANLLDKLPFNVGKGAAAAIRSGGTAASNAVQSVQPSMAKAAGVVSNIGTKAETVVRPVTQVSKPSVRPISYGKQSTAKEEAAKNAPVTPISGMADVKAMVKRHEGSRNKPYKDSLGLWTVGVGHLIGDGRTLPPEMNRTFSDKEVDDLFEEDFAKHVKIAEKTPGYDLANPTGKAAMIDLAFNMGQWWTKWKNTAAALKSGDFTAASQGLQDSAWYKQVGKRAQEIVSMVSQGGGKGGATATKSPAGAPSPASGGGGKGGGGGGAAPAKAAGGATPAPAKPSSPAPLSPKASAASIPPASTPPSVAKSPKPKPRPTKVSQQFGIPSPEYPMVKEDHTAVFFNVNEPHHGVHQ